MADDYRTLSIKETTYEKAERLRAELGLKSVPQLLSELVEAKEREVFGSG